MAASKMGDAGSALAVIVGDPGERQSIRAALADWEGGPLDIHWADTLAQGVDLLVKGRITAVVLGLTLPDCEGLDGFVTVSNAAPQLPVLILSAVRDEGLAQQAVARGASDYLLKTHLDSHSLRRAIRGLIERTAVEEALFAEKERAEVTLNSIGDAVLSTDLAGRVTYLNAVAEAMTGWRREEAAGRHGRRLAVLFVDIDHFKHMNDALGHAIGDRLLQSVAARLTACVRSSDTVSRQGGDEFIVLLSEIERGDDAAATAGKIIES